MNYEFSNRKLYISFTKNEFYLLKQMYETFFYCFLDGNPNYENVERLGNHLKKYFNYDEARKKLVLSNKRLANILEDFILDYNTFESQFKFDDDYKNMLKEINEDYLKTIEDPDDYINYVIKQELYEMWKFLSDYSTIRNEIIHEMDN